jgi:hypothetical protein
MAIAIEPATVTPYRLSSPPYRLPSLCRPSSPMKRSRILNLYLAKRQKRIQKLKSTLYLAIENQHLELKNESLTRENTLLKDSLQRLKEQAFFFEESRHSKEENSRLNEENAHFKEQLRLQASLVNIGVCIRRRFLEKT